MDSVVERAAWVLIEHASIPDYKENGTEDWSLAHCPKCGAKDIYGPNSGAHAQHQAQALADAGLLADTRCRKCSGTGGTDLGGAKCAVCDGTGHRRAET